MAKYEFAGSLFRNEHEMLDAIAAQWVSADGWNGAADPREILHRLTDDLLASRCIDGWGLSRSPDSVDEDHPSHMAENGYTTADLALAFARLRGTILREVAS